MQAANNEKKGYTAEEIKFTTVPMKTKQETGERQTADYVVYWKWKSEPPEAFRKMGIIFERKEVQDFHNTMIHAYDRFDREMERFLTDSKTKIMMVLVEGSRNDALTFIPHNRRYSGDEVKLMIAAKMGAVASIQARGIHVCWQGSRKASAGSIKGYVAHFFEKNIEFVLRDELGDVVDVKSNRTDCSELRSPETSGSSAGVKGKSSSNPKPSSTPRKRSSKAKVTV